MKHEEASDLLAWYAAGTLQENEARAVETHLGQCSDCSQEIQQLRVLHQAVAEEGAEEPVFRKGLLQDALNQIDALEARAESVQESRRLSRRLAAWWEGFHWQASSPGIKFALVGQMALVVALGVVVVMQQVRVTDEATGGVAMVLAGQECPTGSRCIKVIFQDQATAAEIQELLTGINAEVIAGPTALGYYTLVLRAQNAVREREPVASVSASMDLQNALQTIRESGVTKYAAAVME